MPGWKDRVPESGLDRGPARAYCDIFDAVRHGEGLPGIDRELSRLEETVYEGLQQQGRERDAVQGQSHKTVASAAILHLQDTVHFHLMAASQECRQETCLRRVLARGDLAEVNVGLNQKTILTEAHLYRFDALGIVFP